jgi:hypothetical protein
MLVQQVVHLLAPLCDLVRLARAGFGDILPNPMLVKVELGPVMGNIPRLAGGRVQWASARARFGYRLRTLAWYARSREVSRLLPDFFLPACRSPRSL